MARHDWTGAKARHPLAEVVHRSGIALPGNGRTTVRIRCALPDHEDSTPSMDLHLDEDRYYCHGCKARGDQVQWIVDVYRVSKLQALAMIEQPGPLGPPPGGVPVIDRHGAGRAPTRPPADRPDLARTPAQRVLDAVAVAWSYYSYGSLHDAGVEYLQRRGIDVSALEAVERRAVIGRTPYRGERRLADHLHRRGFSDNELVDAGLIIRRPGAEPIDFFRHRIMLPISDPSGRVVGLIGRYDDTVHDLPAGGVKYLNMTRTCVYDKSSPSGLYRPTLGPLERDGQVVVCEGTIDALAIAATAATAGLASKYASIAESGTAISPTQWQAIFSVTPLPPVLCGDGDPAGRDANIRWATDAAKAGRESCITHWPDGQDPAVWLAQHGPAGLAAVTRRGCLDAADGELRPVPAAASVARHLVETGQLAEAAAHVERVIERSARMTDAKGYAPFAAAAAVAAAVGKDDHLDWHRGMDTVVERVATWGARLGPAERLVYCEAAGRELARLGVGPDDWLARKVTAAVQRVFDNGRGRGVNFDAKSIDLGACDISLRVGCLLATLGLGTILCAGIHRG